MYRVLAQNWWLFVLRGLVAVLFGVMALLLPNITLAALVLLFGAYLLVDGVFSVFAALSGHGRRRRWLALLLEGLFGVAAGVLTFVWPGITALVLLYLIAAWAILTGIFEIMVAIRLREEITGEWLMALGGLASVVFGAVLIFRPGAGAVAVVWLIAFYAIVFGAVLLALGFRLRNWRDGLRQERETLSTLPSR